MTDLAPVDLIIIGGYLLLLLGVGLGFVRTAGRSIDRFFVAGRSMPWWLMGVTMACTNFAIDTPIAFTEIVCNEGIPGLWFIWSGAIGYMMVTFVFARLWQRTGVMNDLGLVRLRYGGHGAEVLRVFKGIYFGTVINIFVMGWICLALLKLSATFTSADPRLVLAGAMVVVLATTSAGGLYGTAFSDLLRWGVSLGGAILVAAFAVIRVAQLHPARHGFALAPGIPAHHLDLLPSFAPGTPVPLSAMLTYLLVQWWANKYSDGAGKHVICMLGCRSERDSVLANLLFSVMVQVVHVWPWVIAALAALVLLGGPDKINPSLAYPMLMKTVLPPGVLGFACASLLGAFTSAMAKHLTLATSYVVNDLYRPALRREKSARHYLIVSRCVMVALFALSGLLAVNMDTVAGAWRFLLTFSAGAGLVWVLRWFWWRINAWSELSAMLASGIAAVALEYLVPQWHFTSRLVVTAGVSTVCWLAFTLWTRPCDDATLIEFVSRVRPAALGWRRIYALTGVTPAQPLMRDLVNAGLGAACLTSVSLAIASLLSQHGARAAILFTLSVVTAALLLRRHPARESLSATRTRDEAAHRATVPRLRYAAADESDAPEATAV